VNDGSTDDTLARCEAYACQDARIRVVDQPNHGLLRLADTYNHALQHATGSLVAILEGDDWWPDDKLAVQVAYHQAHPDLVISHGRVIVSDGETDISDYPRPGRLGLLGTSEYLRLLLLRQSCFMPVSVMMDRAALDRIGGFQSYPELPTIDLPTFRILLQQPGKAGWLESTLGYWRQSNTQATGTVFTPDVDERMLKMLLECFHTLPEHLRSALDLQESDVRRASMNRQVLPGLITALRKSLLKRNRREAFQLIRTLLLRGNPRLKMLAIYALPFAVAHSNMEHLYQRKLTAK